MNAELIEQLGEGVPHHAKRHSGDTHSDKECGPADVEAADRIMARAVDEIDRLEREAIERDVAHKRIVAENEEELQQWRQQMGELRERVRAQTHQTQITAKSISDRVNDTLTRLGVVPEGVTLAHPCEQNVGTCVSGLLAETERLQDIVEKLPKTADGVHVVPHVDDVRAVTTGGRIEGRNWYRSDRTWVYGSLSQYPVRVSECYSTHEAASTAVREAAEAALKQQQPEKTGGEP